MSVTIDSNQPGPLEDTGESSEAFNVETFNRYDPASCESVSGGSRGKGGLLFSSLRSTPDDPVPEMEPEPMDSESPPRPPLGTRFRLAASRWISRALVGFGVVGLGVLAYFRLIQHPDPYVLQLLIALDNPAFYWSAGAFSGLLVGIRTGQWLARREKRKVTGQRKHA